MKKSNEAGSTLILESTGRRISPNEGLFSIDIETGEVFEGYDSRCDEAWSDLYPERAFTPEERREIALAMAQAWFRFGGLDPDVVRFKEYAADRIDERDAAQEEARLLRAKLHAADRRTEDMAERVRAVADWARVLRDRSNDEIAETIGTFNRNRDDRREVLEDALERLVVAAVAAAQNDNAGPVERGALGAEAYRAARLLAEPAMMDQCHDCQCGHAKACRNVPRDQRGLFCSQEAAFIRYRARALQERQQRDEGSHVTSERAERPRSKS